MQTVALTRAASEDELFVGAVRRAKTLAQEGVTTFEIKTGYGLDLENEIKILRVAERLATDLELRVIVTSGLYGVPQEFADHRPAYLAIYCNEIVPALARSPLVKAVDVQLDELGFDSAEAAEVFAAAQSLNLDIRVHTDELSDFDGTRFAASQGATTADHLEFVSEAGVQAMAQAGMTAVLLPGNTHVLQRVQRPPTALFRKHDVRVAVATNCNPGPSPATSLLLMMNMACVLYGLTPEEALRATTVHASFALGIQLQTGTLEAGKSADFVIWDVESPADFCTYLGFNPTRAIVYAGAARGVRE